MNEIEGFPTLPFTVVPSLLEHLFRLLCAERSPKSQREVIDIYMTAFFNAWMDNQGLRDEPKRWVAAFAPRTAWGESRARFFGDYTDGRLISLLREPRAWYASASQFSGRYGELDEALELWLRGASELAAAKREDPGRTLLISYETLVADTERVMRSIADWLEIDWAPSLLTPTFNRLPVRANSSFDLVGTNVSEESVERWRATLTPDIIAVVEERTSEAFREASVLADL